MTPSARFTVQLYSVSLHPEAQVGDKAIRFGVPCYWLPTNGASGRVRQDCRLATDLHYTVIPRYVYETVGMRVDSLADSPNVTWQGVACQVGLPASA